MAKVRIAGLKVSNRVRNAGGVQTLFTEYGCNIRTRIGLHQVDGNFCSANGVVLLELFGEDKVCDELLGKLREVDGVEGEVRLHAANGQLEVKGGPREANLETLNSSIKFEGKDSEVVAKTLNGQIELLGVAGDVEASTVSGQIKVVGDHLERVELRTMSGQIELDASLSEHARVFAKTYSGQVRLLLPEGTSARFEIESYSGGVHSDFAAQLEDEEDGGGFGEGRRGELSFRVGDGDSRISIESFSGGVRIERSNR